MLPVLPVIVPLFVAALLAGLTKIIPQRISCLMAMGAAITALVANLLLVRASSTGSIVYWFGNWRPRGGLALGVSFTVEPIGAGLASFACLLTFAALVFSADYFDTAANHFHALLLCFLGAMCGFTLTGDVFNLFVFFELMSAAAFALCAYKTDDPGSLQGALNFAVTNTVAAYFVLVGIALLYARTGALNMAQMGRALASGPVDQLVVIAFVFLVCGYLVKAAVVPFHFWLADAHAVAPSPVCILFSGVMAEMGLFAMTRLYWTTFHSALLPHLGGVRHLFLALGILSAATGAVMCYTQRNLKRLLAFSTISHVGLMTAGLSLFTAQGLAGAAVYVLGHGLVKASLFLVAGILLHRFEGVDEFELHGKGRGERWSAIIFFSAAISLAGVPLSGLSAGSALMQASASELGLHWLQWIHIAVSAITSAAVLRAGGRIFLGWGSNFDPGDAPKSDEKQETEGGHQETPLTMLLPATCLVLAGLLLGLVPGLASASLHAASNFIDTEAYAAHVLDGQSFHGPASVTAAPRESFEGLLAALVAIAIAALHLLKPIPGGLSSFIARPVQFLHGLHSGHVGDYVTFLALGIGLIGLVSAYCFT